MYLLIWGQAKNPNKQNPSCVVTINLTSSSSSRHWIYPTEHRANLAAMFNTGTTTAPYFKQCPPIKQHFDLSLLLNRTCIPRLEPHLEKTASRKEHEGVRYFHSEALSPLWPCTAYFLAPKPIQKSGGDAKRWKKLGPSKPLPCLELLAETPTTLLCPIRCQINPTSSSTQDWFLISLMIESHFLPFPAWQRSPRSANATFCGHWPLLSTSPTAVR